MAQDDDRPPRLSSEQSLDQTEEEEALLTGKQVDRHRRGFSWRDVALTVLDNVSEDEIERESARLRLRFVAVKEQLARAAAAHGITPRPEQSDGNIEDADQRRTDELRGPRGDR